LCVALSLFSHVRAAQIIAFGDSWATYGRTPLANEMAKHNVTVDNVGVSGTTTNDWAAKPNYLRDTVRENPDARFVWLTIGGNDAKNELPTGKTIPEIVEEVTERTKIFLDPLFEDNPTIRVIQFGYDVATFSKGILCPLFGSIVFAHCKGNVTCVNTDFLHLQYDYVEPLDNYYPRHDSVNLLGTLQQYGGIPDASVGHPNLAYYSPDDLMLDNCIHPNAEGFEVIFAEFWDIYFKGKFNETSGEFYPPTEMELANVRNNRK